mmetsp:Transcript_41781/g.58310  ORF Transcript_41781/g.58310 Transcript_41781/m.58310 type:complete len:83 (-) Transcript_41781:45-293(-)
MGQRNPHKHKLLPPEQQSKRCVGQGSCVFVFSSINKGEDWRRDWSSMLGEDGNKRKMKEKMERKKEKGNEKKGVTPRSENYG